MQDYLKALYKLQKDGPVSTTDLAKEIGVSGASVTGMLKRLSKLNLVDYNSYKGARLTETGEKMALEILRFHRLLELFLRTKLNFPLEKVHDEACRLEHCVSDEFAERIDELMGRPRFDPHGHPIPTKDGKIVEIDEVPLTDADVGSFYSISRICDTEPQILSYFEDNRYLPGSFMKIIEKSPFKGPITVEIDGKEKIIGYEVASKIFVSKKKD